MKFIKNCTKIKKIKKYSYGFFSNKNWLEKAVKERKYKLSYRFVPTQCVIENSKQKVKKFKKLEEYQFGSFKAKRGLEMPRKRENKNYCSVPFLHDT